MVLHTEISHLLSGTTGLGADDVADVVGVLLLMGGAPVDDPREQAIFDGFAARADLEAGLQPAEIGRRVAAYFAARPSLSLVTRIGQLIREERSASPGMGGGGLADVIGANVARGILGGGARPQGTVPAGPAARSALLHKLDKKKG